MFLTGLLTTMEEPVAYDKMSDEKLLLRVAEGDKAAFQQLYQNTDKTIYGFILSILRNPQDSEEVMQELYLKVWTSAGSYQSQGKPLAWMFTIARNLCYMRFRDQKHEADIGLSDLSEMETGEFCPHDINRKINGVIKVDQAADDVIEQECQCFRQIHAGKHAIFKPLIWKFDRRMHRPFLAFHSAAVQLILQPVCDGG